MVYTFVQTSNETSFSNVNKIYRVFSVKNKKHRRSLSKYLRLIQYCSHIKVDVHPFPKVLNYEWYINHNPYNTIRCDVVEMVRRLTMEGHTVIAEVYTVL